MQVAGNYAYVADGDAGLQILKLSLGYPQTLEFQLPDEIPFQGLPIVSVGVASSGLPITLSVLSGPATVVNNQLILTGLGPVTLHAEQAGDNLFLPASAQRIVTVTPPQLGVRRADGEVELFWASGLAGYKLQSTESLSPGSQWQDVTASPV